MSTVQYWGLTARLAINEMYFDRLLVSQLCELSTIHLDGRTIDDWKELVVQLYARGKLQDENHAKRLIDVFIAWPGAPWISMYEYAKANDPHVYENMEADARVMAAVAKDRELLHRERGHGDQRAPPRARSGEVPEHQRINEAYFSGLSPAQLRDIARIQWNDRHSTMDWRGIVDQLYVQRKIKDATRGQDLCLILGRINLADADWLCLMEHARLYDEPAAVAFEADEAICAAVGRATEAKFKETGGYGCFPEFRMEKK